MIVGFVSLKSVYDKLCDWSVFNIDTNLFYRSEICVIGLYLLQRHNTMRIYMHHYGNTFTVTM